jgi:hypothetical protein
VKFVEADADELDAIRARLVALAEHHGVMPCPISASATRLHMIQDIFFAVSRSLDWSAMAQSFVEALMTGRGYAWPRPGDGATFQDLAAYNEIDVRFMRRDVNRWLTEEIMRDRLMSQDFRIAMATLCRTRLEPDETDECVTTPVLDWLRGELRAIGALRQTYITAKSPGTMAGRCCARSAAGSGSADARGCALRSIFVRSRARELLPATLRYTPAAVIDAFECCAS